MPTQQIVNRQIADQAIDDAKVKAGANIASSKLADGGNFIKKDGSVALVGDWSAGNNRITNVNTPSSGGDAANKSYVDTQIGSLSALYKYRNVRAIATGNINLSNPGTAVFDGVTLSAGDRFLAPNQTTQSQNGIYVFNGSSSAATRAADSDAWNEFPGSLVSVNEGTTYADTRWYCPVNDGGTLGTTAITYTQDTSTGLTSSNFVDEEVPSGSMNGSNTSFTLAYTPTAGTLKLYLNGLKLRAGSGNDYTLSGTTITMAYAPGSTEYLSADYRK